MTHLLFHKTPNSVSSEPGAAQTDVSDLSEGDKALAKSKLRKLSKHSRKRNIIAHAPFGPDSTNTGVEFFTVRARGKFETPKIVWSPRQFAQEIIALSDYTKIIDNLQKRFKDKPLTQESYTAAALPFIQTQWPEPIPRTLSPAIMNSVFGAPFPPFGSNFTPDTSSQTPEKSSE